MIKPIFNPNAKNNMAEIIPILLARKCRGLYLTADRHPSGIYEAVCGLDRIDRKEPRSIDPGYGLFTLVNGSVLKAAALHNAASCLRGQQYSAIYVQAHKFDSPELSHEEFVQLATDHLAESRDNLHQMLVDTGAIKADETLPSSLTKQAE